MKPGRLERENHRKQILIVPWSSMLDYRRLVPCPNIWRGSTGTFAEDSRSIQRRRPPTQKFIILVVKRAEKPGQSVTLILNEVVHYGCHGPHDFFLPSGNLALENDHRTREFSHENMFFHSYVNVYQRVSWNNSVPFCIDGHWGGCHPPIEKIPHCRLNPSVNLGSYLNIIWDLHHISVMECSCVWWHTWLSVIT